MNERDLPRNRKLPRPANRKLETREFTIDLPQASDPLGRWFEANGASVSVSCSLGKWCATVKRNRLHTYSDEQGSHSESWEIDREGPTMGLAIDRALKAAGAPV
jgi:hypothetical protein